MQSQYTEHWQYALLHYLRQNMMINTAHHNLNKTRLTDQVHAEFKRGHFNMKRIRLQETIGLFIKIISTC